MVSCIYPKFVFLALYCIGPRPLKMVQTCSAINCKVRRTRDVKMKFHRIPLDPSLREKWLNAINRLDFKPGKTAALCEQHFKEEDYELNPYGNRCLKKGAVPSIFFSSCYSECFTKHKKNIPSTKTQELTKEESYNTQKHASTLAINENKETCIKLSVVSSREKQELLSNINNASLLRDLEDTDSEFLDDEQDKQDDEKSSEIDTDEPPSSEVEEQETTSNKDDESVDDNMDIPYSPRKRSRSDPVYFGDFEESDLDSEIKRKRFWKVAQETVSKFKKLNEYYRCLLYKKEKKIEHLHELFDYLMQEKQNANEELLVVKVVE